ncbi:glucosidase 2 subunit beta isoform X2 [Physcomitrium patens]|uniref:Glucosidase 2 subunit beta n=1 Tax=Physcomitrium patens TaxID=3218 RepID=A0A7I4CAH2_PHYPA|nr:glucosidase 2 subunit beta-like isoform X1 [Physcomitrium patens]|eukprot:XP_024361244.1 glucosidase 2 subunit beta-like isoform X1 [Physcomitrella patens]
MKTCTEHPSFLLLLLLAIPLPLSPFLLVRASSSSLLGIAPPDLKYFEGSTFLCKDGSKRVPKARLNDNFCDCVDGTDEPGTSACPQSRFYCKNVGYVPQKIYSSRVNDGICDCCDGSDEYNGFVECPNTCWDAGKASREKLAKQVNVYKEGVKIRRSEIEGAKKLRQQNDIKLVTLRSTEKKLSDQVQKLKVEKESIEEREKRELADQQRETEKEAEKKRKAASSLREEVKSADQQSNTESGVVESDSKAQKADGASHETKAECAPTLEETNEDAPEVRLTDLEDEPKLEALSKEDLGRVVAARWTGEDTTVHVPEENESRDLEEDSFEDQDNEADLDSDAESEHVDSEDDEYSSPSEEQQVPETSHEPKKLAWWQRFIPGMMKRFYRKPVDKSEAERIRNQYSEATTQLATVQHQISELESKLKEDFGPEAVFYSFHDKCFELKVQKYNYKVCPFKQAIQQEGHMSTRLGNWDGFKDNYTVMMFSSGDRCWNGPDRSLRVKLLCGVRTELRNVDEPSRCDYVAELVTPTLCLESKLQVLANLGKEFVSKKGLVLERNSKKWKLKGKVTALEMQKKLDRQLSGVHDEL